MNAKFIEIEKLTTNTGQVPGLPRNPRTMNADRMKALMKSIEDAPEMLELREVIAYPHNGEYVVVCGNMRLEACRKLGIKKIPCKILDEQTPVEKLKEYAIKDNIAFGEDDWNLLQTEWDTEELESWGMEIKDFEHEEKIRDIEIKPLIQNHVLISYPIDKHDIVVERLKSIRDLGFCEILSTAN